MAAKPIPATACGSCDASDPRRGRDERDGNFSRAQAAEAPAPRAIDTLHDWAGRPKGGAGEVAK